MPAADKCHLNIPFKDYLKGLRVDKDGKLSQAQLDRIASQEFENYKAIERRINDPDCAGGGECACDYFQAEAYGFTPDGMSNELAISAAVGAEETLYYSSLTSPVGSITIASGELQTTRAGVISSTLSIQFAHNSGADDVQVKALSGSDQQTDWVPAGYDSYLSLSDFGYYDSGWNIDNRVFISSTVSATRSFIVSALIGGFFLCGTCASPAAVL